MPANHKKPANAVKLSSPGMPADSGLTSLGLLMQIGGSLFLGCMLFLAIGAVYAGIFLPKAFDIVLIALLSAGRSAAHVSAGRSLVHGSTAAPVQSPLAATRRYIWLALGQTAICTILLHDLVGEFSMAMTMGATWAAWPVTLWLVLRSSRYQDLDAGIPRSEDHGFEGASIYMLLFGVIGALFSVLVIYQLVALPGSAFASFEILSMVIMFGVLLGRSVLHLMAGRRGIAGDLVEFADQTKRYTRFAALATVIVGVLLFISAGRDGSSFMFVFLVVYLLLAWPRILSRFMDQSDVDRYITGADKHRPPDMGLTALGWLLLALSVHSLAGELAFLIWPDQGMDSVMFGLMDNTPLAAHFDQSPWLSLLTSATQLWAGISLVRMNNDQKLAPTVYGVVATGLTLYTVWPLFADHSLMESLLSGPMATTGITLLGQVGIALTVPLTALALVRRQPLARAQARYRPDGQNDQPG